ncbi:Nucleoid occlusion protein [bioreactor metagenome]|uniref:Nucleoid occlusion protein n=1 Tax=bioreactor metagenome TaxID=1076179 RepID=A0A645HFA1_9ZZZZ
MIESRLTERHARALLRLRDEKTQMEIIDRIRAGNLSVKETEKLVENTLDRLYDEKADGAKPRPRIIRLYKDYRLFLNTVKSSFSHLKDSGMPADMKIDETEEYVQVYIRLPKK